MVAAENIESTDFKSSSTGISPNLRHLTMGIMKNPNSPVPRPPIGRSTQRAVARKTRSAHANASGPIVEVPVTRVHPPGNNCITSAASGSAVTSMVAPVTPRAAS